MQQVLDVSNEVAAELAGVEDGVLDALRERLHCTIGLRGNRLTLGGDDANVAAARAVVDELVELVEGGHDIGPDTVGAVLAALDQVEDVRDVFDDVVWRHRGKNITPKTVNQKRYVDAIRSATVTFGIGPAGTGKTYLAMALAVSALSEGAVGRVILTRPAVEAGERLGFLPGDMLAKVDPYLRPLYDALYDMLDPDRLAAYMEKGTIEVAPLAFMRGRTLNDSFVILDEAQNTTSEQMKMFLTRLGFGAKAVITGDITQIDLPIGRTSGLVEAMKVVGSIEGISFIHFDDRDVVRHKLVQQIVKAYDAFSTARSARSASDLALAASMGMAGTDQGMSDLVEQGITDRLRAELHLAHVDLRKIKEELWRHEVKTRILAHQHSKPEPGFMPGCWLADL
jgi:phosphate starvation-inducible PhoH-like protein